LVWLLTFFLFCHVGLTRRFVSQVLGFPKKLGRFSFTYAAPSGGAAEEVSGEAFRAKLLAAAAGGAGDGAGTPQRSLGRLHISV
jgi:hypothetical protein